MKLHLSFVPHAQLCSLMTYWTKQKVHASICNGADDIKQFMGWHRTCDVCERKIELKGQVIIFGNIKFIDLCSDHIELCILCGCDPEWQMNTCEEIGAVYFCSKCIELSNDEQLAKFGEKVFKIKSIFLQEKSSVLC